MKTKQRKVKNKLRVKLPPAGKYRLSQNPEQLYSIRVPVGVVIVVIRKTNQIGVASNATWAERLLEMARRINA